MVFESMNFVAVLVAAVASFAWGMLYYSPLMCGKQWMALAKIKMSKKDKVWPSMVGGAVTALVTAGVIGVLLQMTTTVGAEAGAVLGLWAWFGFQAPASFGIVLWEKKPVKLWLLNNGYSLVNLVMMGAIIGAWV